MAAGHGRPKERAAALETLCRTYWEPLYSYIRRRGHQVSDAQDLTQGFFAHLLSGQPFEHLSPERGKFRSFLLASLKNFLADERNRAAASKRGGSQVFIPLDVDAGERHLQQEPSEGRSVESLYDCRWALALMNRAFVRLRDEFQADGKAAQFEAISLFLSQEGNGDAYGAVATRLGIRTGAVAVAVHRLRLRYRELIRAEIAHTVASPVEVADEMRYLLALLSR